MLDSIKYGPLLVLGIWAVLSIGLLIFGLVIEWTLLSMVLLTVVGGLSLIVGLLLLSKGESRQLAFFYIVPLALASFLVAGMLTGASY